MASAPERSRTDLLQRAESTDSAVSVKITNAWDLGGNVFDPSRIKAE